MPDQRAQPDDRSRARSDWRTAIVSWAVGPLFLALAAWFLLIEGDPLPEIPRTPGVSAERLEPVPRAALMTDPPVIAVGGFEQRCNECHRLFQTPPERIGPLYQHTHIEFNHGLNNRCFNCHDLENRQVLVLRDGRTLPFARSPELCSQCHGTTYRDWQRGMHGKTLGAWRPDDPAMRRLLCVQCHDPHAPAYDPYEPLPAPHTLRTPIAGEHAPPHADEANPLLMRRPEHDEPDADDEHDAPEGAHPSEGGHTP